MLKVGIVGCGKIADVHVGQIQRVSNCRIVGVCDTEPLMAEQLAERFGIKCAVDDVADLLRVCRPDVVHITTPPGTHCEIARYCIERGCHVYIEKPMALEVAGVRELIERAEAQGVKLTAGHDDQFGPAARRLRRLVRGGFLGGPPVHLESYYCYDLGESDYARAFIGNGKHWVRELPGGLLQNVISHGIARIAEYLVSDEPRVIAQGLVSPEMRKLGGGDIVDELRVSMLDGEGTTAYFTFSSQMRPALRQFRMYGPANGVVLDQDQEVVIRLRGRRFKSHAEKFVAPALIAKEYAGAVVTNAREFGANELHMKAGMKWLIAAFYRSIENGTPVPIPYRELLRVATIMDSIFAQIGTHRKPERRSDVHAAVVPQFA